MNLGFLGLESIPNDVLFWITAGIVLLAIEITTVGFFCLFFAIGAFATASIAYFVQDISTQVVLFAAISLMTFGFARPILKKALNISEKLKQESNIQALIGKPALVLETVHRHGGRVKVTHTGEVWSAFLHESSEQLGLQPDSEVMIVNVDGAKLAIREKTQAVSSEQ